MLDHNAAEDLKHRALTTLRNNVRSGYDPYYRRSFSTYGHRQDATRGSGFGDSCFHAIALARLDPEMARKELLTLVASQRDDGFIGHMVYWGRLGAIRSIGFAQGPVSEWRRRHTGMIQPPVLAQAVEAVHKASDDGRFLEEILPATSAYYDWIARERGRRRGRPCVHHLAVRVRPRQFPRRSIRTWACAVRPEKASCGH